MKRRLLALVAAASLMFALAAPASATPAHVCGAGTMQVNAYSNANLSGLISQLCVAGSIYDPSWGNTAPYSGVNDVLSSLWVYVPDGTGCLTFYNDALYAGGFTRYRLVVGQELYVNNFTPNDTITSSRFVKLVSTSSTCPN